jgi:hypothetical protein
LFEIPFKQLSDQEKKERVKMLWKIAFGKAKGAALVIRKVFEQNDRIFTGGYKSKENLRYKE